MEDVLEIRTVRGDRKNPVCTRPIRRDVNETQPDMWTGDENQFPAELNTEDSMGEVVGECDAVRYQSIRKRRKKKFHTLVNDFSS
jgi:hypothetical protein